MLKCILWFLNDKLSDFTSKIVFPFSLSFIPICSFSECRIIGCCGARGVWEEGGGREPAFRQSSGALGGWTREDCKMLSTWPRVGIWLCEATDPTRRRVDKGQPLVPDSQSPASHTGYGGGAENRIGALGQ